MLRLALALMLAASCGGDDPKPVEAQPVQPAEPKPPEIVGSWRATLASPGGELPFTLEFSRERDDAPLAAVVINGPERVAVSSLTWEGRELVLRFDPYDSEIRATGTGTALAGRWVKATAKGPASMRFTAKFGEAARFGAPVGMPKHNVPVSVEGDWSVVFTEEDGSTYPAQGIFTVKDSRVDATFITETGDYRYLDGRYKQGFLELSCFDGGHAFLFRARVEADGSLLGDFWSRGSSHATWRAVRMEAGDPSPLSDPYAIVEPAEPDAPFKFAFPDLDGNVIGDDDPRFQGKVVLLEAFGTWCPNCNDYAPLLAKWDAEYGSRGLQIVGLAFEMTGEPERDRTVVRTYGEKHGLKFPLLLAGTSDKAEAAKALPSLTKVASFPTTILVGRDGKVRKIHSGFSGPATGKHHLAMVASLRAEIEALLAETP